MRIDGWIGICLLMIHILTCIFVYLGIKSHKIPVKMYIFPLVVFDAGFRSALLSDHKQSDILT